MQMHVDLCWFIIPWSSLIWPKDYLNMCHIFYYNFSVNFLQSTWIHPQQIFQTKILEVTSLVNHVRNLSSTCGGYQPSPHLYPIPMIPFLACLLKLSCASGICPVPVEGTNPPPIFTPSPWYHTWPVFWGSPVCGVSVNYLWRVPTLPHLYPIPMIPYLACLLRLSCTPGICPVPVEGTNPPPIPMIPYLACLLKLSCASGICPVPVEGTNPPPISTPSPWYHTWPVFWGSPVCQESVHYLWRVPTLPHLYPIPMIPYLACLLRLSCASGICPVPVEGTNPPPIFTPSPW